MIPFTLPGVRAVGFDLDGTLLDHPAAAAAGARAVVRSLGVEATGAHEEHWFAAERVHFQRWLDGDTDWQQQRRDRIGDLYDFIGRQRPSDAHADAGFDVFRAAYADAWRPYPDVVETLERLRAGGVIVAILTNGPGWQQREKLEGIGIAHLVDVMCAADEIDAPKPDPRAFSALCAAVDVAPEHMLFIGDDAHADVAGAQASGIRAALVRARSRGVAELPSAVRRAAASMISDTRIAPHAG